MQQAIPAVEWWAVGLALVYVVLAARDSVWCWPFAFVSSCLWAWQVWVRYDLLFDALLNGFYALMAIVGLLRWLRPPATGAVSQPIVSMPVGEHIRWISGGMVVTVVGVVLAKAYTSAALPVADALTTVFSIVGTILLIQRKLENWLYLLAMDVIYVWLYLERGSVLFAILFVVYSILAVVGYFAWRKLVGAQAWNTSK